MQSLVCLDRPSFSIVPTEWDPQALYSFLVDEGLQLFDDVPKNLENCDFVLVLEALPRALFFLGRSAPYFTPQWA